MIGDPRDGITQTLLQQQLRPRQPTMARNVSAVPLQPRVMQVAPMNMPQAPVGGFASALNNAMGNNRYPQPYAPATPNTSRPGGDLGMSGVADPSMWNTSLPTGGWGY